MSYRGRLLFPFEVELYRIDTDATSGDPDGAGPLVSGYDPIFREPILVTQTDGSSVDARKELAPIRVPCQVEEDWKIEEEQKPQGYDPYWKTTFVFHFADLENAGLVDAEGTAKIHVNDRASAIFTRNTGELVQRLDTNSPGLFCISVVPHSFGLSSLRRNLLVATFIRRMKAP